MPASERSVAPEKEPIHNLPLEEAFIGREAELGEIKEALARSRFVTIKGVGGCGKTTVALHLAHQQLGHYSGWVWQIKLGDLQRKDATLVPQTVGRTIRWKTSMGGISSVPEPKGGAWAETIGETLGNRAVLLVFDNCEHVSQNSVEIAAALLRACPNLNILATSRVRLGFQGATQEVYELPPLSLPPKNGGGTFNQGLEIIQQSDAVRLFVDRARREDSRFCLTSEKAAIVASICSSLDGIPFAITLAAAREKTFGLEGIYKGLGDRFRLLHSKTSGIHAHQRTLLTTVDWSYALLDRKEQDLLKRIAVILGAWSLDAAKQICSGRGIDQEDVADILAGLVDNSLLEVERTSTGGNDYRLLETTRLYAIRKQKASELRMTREQHRNFFFRIAKESEPSLRKVYREDAIELVDQNYENIRAALTWISGVPDALAIRLEFLAALVRFWEKRGYFMEGRQWLEDALAEGDLTAKMRPDQINTLAKIHYGVGALAYRQAEFETARSSIEKALELLDRTDKWLYAKCLSRLGAVLREMGEYELFRNHSQDALRLMVEIADAEGILQTTNSLGVASSDRFDYDGAARYFRAALEMAQRLEDKSSSAVMENNLGIIERNRGNYDLAESLHRSSLRKDREIRDQTGTALALYNLGIVLDLKSRTSEAVECYREMMEISKRLRDKRGIALCLEGLARTWISRNNPELATYCFGAATTLRLSIKSPVEPNELHSYKQALDLARRRMGESRFQAAFKHGQSMDRELVIRHALERRLANERGLKEVIDSEYSASLTDAISKFLKVDCAVQLEFGEAIRGKYLVFRYNSHEDLVIAEMDVSFASDDQYPIPAYRTRRPKGSTGIERIVQGYIYKSDEYIIALGTIENTSIPRYSLLTTVKKKERLDMYGLRLGISAVDVGPYSHRVYGRRLTDNSQYGQLPDITGIVSEADDSKKRKLRELVDDLDEILSLLREPSPRGGLGLALPIRFQ